MQSTCKINNHMKYLKLFEELNQEILNSSAAKAIDLKKSIDALNDLMELGIMDNSTWKNEYSKIINSYKKMIRGLSLDLKDKTNLGVLFELSAIVGVIPDLSKLEGFNELLNKGLHLVSSPTQLINGTLVFSLDDSYNRKTGWGIGFFPEIKAIRRMTPKNIGLGVWGRREGSMDIIIKHFRDSTSKLDFYDKAMKWAADNINFHHAKENPEATSWKYYKKRKGSVEVPRGEAETLLAKATELYAINFNLIRKVLYYRLTNELSREEKKKAYQILIEVNQLRAKAFELIGNAPELEKCRDNIKKYQEELSRI